MSTTNILDKPTLAIIGLGYVGLPLAVAFSEQYSVIGYDINASRIEALQKGIDNTLEVSADAILQSKGLQFTNTLKDIANASIYIITVPTPIDAQKKPDLRFLLNASSQVGSVLKKGDIVIYESTVYPGCTEEDCVPVLSKSSGLQYNVDYFVGYSPERINPGDKVNTLTKIKKLTSGSTPLIADKVDTLYQSIITAGTYKTSNIKVAEAAKAIENAQRDINISFVNELALIFDKMDLDTHEVLEAAATKWNFLRFTPGLVGGHCIGVDPYYLAEQSIKKGYAPQVILSGRNVNDSMAHFVADKLIRLLLVNNISIKGASILLLGVTFKENCPDIRNSKVFDIVSYLKDKAANVSVFDPYANATEVSEQHQIELITEFSKYDGIVITTGHHFFKSLDFNQLKKGDNSIVFDTKAIIDRDKVNARL
jgi:UDP-N-acetyl-D-galactosamine dehydrogenase